MTKERELDGTLDFYKNASGLFSLEQIEEYAEGWDIRLTKQNLVDIIEELVERHGEILYEAFQKALGDVFPPLNQ